MLTLATYAVNYAWYCFFLTPTFVLMSMPYFRDWQYAGVRMANTVLGAAVAVLAMRLLWPEHEQLELGRLLGRGAKADAAYLQAMVRFWKVDASARVVAERQLIAPARRLSGLAINDAEESLDRMMLEPAFGRKATSGDIQAEALTFVDLSAKADASGNDVDGCRVWQPADSWSRSEDGRADGSHGCGAAGRRCGDGGGLFSG